MSRRTTLCGQVVLFVAALGLSVAAQAGVNPVIGASTYTDAERHGGALLVSAAEGTQYRVANHQTYNIRVAGADVKLNLAMTMKWIDLPRVVSDNSLPKVAWRYFDALYWVSGDDMSAAPPAGQSFTVAVPWDWSKFEDGGDVRWETSVTLPHVDSAGKAIIQYRLIENRTIQIYSGGDRFDASAVEIDDVALSLEGDKSMTHNGTFDTGIAGWQAQGEQVKLSAVTAE